MITSRVTFFLLFLIASFLSNTCFGQEEMSITGKIISTNPEYGHMPGVAVLVNGPNRGTYSDANGEFKIGNVSPNDILIFSFVGYQTLEVAVENTAELVIHLQEIGRVTKVFGKYRVFNYSEEKYPKGYVERIKERGIIPTDTQAPTITITSPKNAQERGVGKPISTAPTLNVQGQITDNEKVTAAWLNGQVLALQADGSFLQSVPLTVGTNSLVVEATDAAQNKATFRFEVERRAEATVSTAFGTYHALLIAAKDYKDPSITDLTFPVSDAQKLKEVLQNKYAFAPQNIKFLSNPTRSELLAALGRYSEQLTDKDNLLIFYAGHGEWDAKLRQGYWLLADAKAIERGNWFSNADLKTYLGGISTKHTLLISDACFSGSIFQGRSNAPNRAVTALAETPSRRAMTSGTLKTVPDESVFMRYLLKRLTENSEPYLSAQSLFSSFREAVINNLPAGSNLIPQYGVVQEAGDEGGDFVFVKK